MSKDEAIALAAQLSVTVQKQTKKAVFDELQHRLFQRKQTLERTAF